MINKETIFCTLLFTIILSSCGTNKKLAATQAHAADLEAQNKELSQKVQSMQKEVAELSARNQSMAEDYTKYKQSCEATEQKLKTTQEDLNEMESKLLEVAETIDRLEERLDSALADFESRGVEVHSEDHIIYVTMEDQLLYKSGSATLGTEGKKALGVLASVLNDYPNLKVIVVGNTDNVTIKGPKDNWTLSTERANGVVRILRDDYKMDPTRLTAAGKGKYNPVTDNSTAGGRAKNRRIDIVLNPDMEKLWESVKEK